MPHLNFEKNYYSQNKLILGIDEVGRGCLAGPMAVGGVILSDCFDEERCNYWLSHDIRDSKKHTLKQRIKNHKVILDNCVWSYVSFISADEINKHGIVKAFMKGVLDIIEKVTRADIPNDIILFIDGNSLSFPSRYPKKFIVKGDDTCLSIAAASILAKVERDNYMEKLSENYTNYDWINNKGYGTKKHQNALKTFGITPHHRLQFIQKIHQGSTLINNR